MLVFIDESGDPGFKLAKGSSPTFVLCLVAFRDSEQSRLAAAAICAAAERHKVRPEFKFANSRDAVRDAFFEAVLPFDFCVRAIVIQKERVYSANLRKDKEKFYSFFVKSMLKFDNGLLREAKIVLDGSGDAAFKKELSAYLRRNLAKGAVSRVVFSNSRSDVLVQMADMCTGAIARSYRQDRARSSRWFDMLRPRIEDIWDFK